MNPFVHLSTVSEAWSGCYFCAAVRAAPTGTHSAIISADTRHGSTFSMPSQRGKKFHPAAVHREGFRTRLGMTSSIDRVQTCSFGAFVCLYSTHGGILSAMASLEKSRNSMQTGVGVEPLFMLRCDRDIGHADLVASVGVTATRIPGYACSIPTWCAAVTSPSGLFHLWEKEHDQRSSVRDRARSTST